MMNDRPRRVLAFTLIELLVVIAIMALLLVILAPSFSQLRSHARTAQCAANLHHLGEAARARQAAEKRAPLRKGWQQLLSPYALQPNLFLCPEGEPNAHMAETLKMHDLSNGFFTPFIEGPWVVKLSQTQYDQVALRERMTVRPPPYEPDDDPHIYWLCFEDWRSSNSDNDYEDLRVKVTEHFDGKAELMCKIGSTGHNLTVVDEENDLLATKSQMQGGYTLWVGAGLTSYGMNVDAFGMSKAGQVFILDYNKHLAASDHSWQCDEQGRPTFARHLGLINVLHIGGDVRPTWPDAIDPRTQSVARDLWQQ